MAIPEALPVTGHAQRDPGTGRERWHVTTSEQCFAQRLIGLYRRAMAERHAANKDIEQLAGELEDSGNVMAARLAHRTVPPASRGAPCRTR